MDIKIYCLYHKLVPIDDVIPHPENENKHPDEQIEVLAKVIQKNGIRSPIVVSNLSGMISKGHGRLLALKKIGMTEVPVEFQDYEDAIAEMRDRNADNNIARYAEFDQEKFNLNLQKHEIKLDDNSIQEFGYVGVSVEDLGITQDEDSGSSGNDDVIPEIEEDNKLVEKNDIWVFGAYYECDDCGTKLSVEEAKENGMRCAC